MKYAEEAGAACEEMKHGIEEVIKNINVHYDFPYKMTDFVNGFQVGLSGLDGRDLPRD